MEFDPEKIYQGTVKFYNQKNKFGFIRVDETNDEIYTKQSYLLDSISDDDRVQFKIKMLTRGAVAFDVSIIKD